MTFNEDWLLNLPRPIELVLPTQINNAIDTINMQLTSPGYTCGNISVTNKVAEGVRHVFEKAGYQVIVAARGSGHSNVRIEVPEESDNAV